MENYKSPIHRLAHLFKKGRDLWKNRALARQKKLKALEVKVRDLSISRDNWKLRAKSAETKLHQVEKTKPSKLKKCNDIPLVGEFIQADECSTLIPARHQNPVFIIQLAIQQFTVSLNSFRGCQSTFESFSKFFAIPTPSFSNIRNWILRAGLYQLRQLHEYASDWIYILDMTIELGQVKCLVVLGIRKSHLEELLSEQDFRGLKHQDLVVLSLEILYSSNGEIIEQCLNKLSDKVGVPIQIISDHGSDVKKGVDLFIQKHPITIYTYDVTHYMALLFKDELENDECYQSFLKHCSETRNNIQQTRLNFLIPPSQKHQSRYLNVEKLVKWGAEISIYQDNGDFSDISTQFRLESDSYELIKGQFPDNKAVETLEGLVNQTYQSQQDFEVALNVVSTQLNDNVSQIIIDHANLGRKLFEQKLGWFKEYNNAIPVYSQMVNLVHLAEKQLSHHGISKNSSAIFLEETKNQTLPPRLENFKGRINDYLETESSKIPQDDFLWANSNVVESIFGKYKIFIEKSPLREISKLILTIPLCTVKITGQFIKNAMESTSIKDIERWAGRIFDKSTLSKKRTIFKPDQTTLNLHEKC
jgi:hypothetical protein